MSFNEVCFKTNPNFRFQEIVTDKSDALSNACIFDVFKDKDKNIILIAPFFDPVNIMKQDYHVSLIDLKDNKEIRKLEGHNDRILTCRYFKDPSSENDYIISADRKSKVIVWDISNDFNKKLDIDLEYEAFIYSCLLIFDENQNRMLAVASSISSNNITKVIDCQTRTIEEIQESRDTNVYYLDCWKNTKPQDNTDTFIIIQCGKGKIIMSTFPGKQSYHVVETGENNPYVSGGLVFKNKDKELFAASSTYGMVQIINLETKKTEFSIKLDDVHLYSFTKWNDYYLLLIDCLQKRIIVFDLEDGYQIKSKVLCPEMHFEKFIKKVEHPKYGESILSVGIDFKIKLFINRNIIKNKKD